MPAMLPGSTRRWPPTEPTWCWRPSSSRWRRCSRPASASSARHHEEVVLPTLRLQEEGLADLPADLPSEAYDLWRYSVIVYGRAPMFVDRVRQHLGPDAFREAMRGLVARHRGGHITADDLLRAWRAHTDDPDTIDALHRAWIREAHAYEGLLETP